MQKLASEKSAFDMGISRRLGRFFNKDQKDKAKIEYKTTNNNSRCRNFFEKTLKYNPIAKDIISDEHSPFQLMTERLTETEFKEVSSITGLRVRLFMVRYPCEKWNHHQQESENFFSSLPSVDFLNEPHHEVLYQLENSKFIGYASVVIIVHRLSLLMSILEAMEGNPYLRYKTKFILCRHQQHFAYSTNVPYRYQPNRLQDKLLSIKTILSQVEEFIEGASAICLKIHDQAVTRDASVYQGVSKCRQIDNTLLLHWMEEDYLSGRYGYAFVLYVILLQPYSPLKPTLKEAFQHLVSTPNADLYLYSINPALAIIINNYYFTNPHTIREGSQQDVVNLIRELKIARIPYILVEDCNQKELLQILDYIENKDFRPLKSFLVFLMSHGDSDDVIYTYDGQLDIKSDILERIQANKSLEYVKRLLAIIACRGGIDAEYADYDDLTQIHPTATSHLTENTIVMYSVPNQIQSIRSPQTGCPFVQSFCQHFRHIGHTDDVRVLDEKINDDLRELNYFQGLKKCSELLVRDANQRHNIIQMPVKVLEMLHLLKSIADDFPKLESNDAVMGDGCCSSSYVCGVLNATKFEKDASVRKYFVNELEWDTFSLIGN